MVKRLTGIFLSFLIILSALGAARAQEKELVLAYVDFPPYEYMRQGKPEGILVTIVQTLFTRAGIPIRLTFLPFKRAYEETRKGNIDGLFNLYKNADRLAFFDYSHPVIENPLVLFVRKDFAAPFSRLEDLKGLRVGAMVGYTYGAGFDNSTLFFKDYANTHQSNFTKLAVGRIDLYPCDKRVGLYITEQNDLAADLKILPRPLIVMDGHIGFTKNRHREVLEKINPIIQTMRENGEITQIIHMYLPNPAHQDRPF